ncbi:MAG: galactosyldiacylglycerol synthase [Paenibacillaceae bacterium]|jgi:processive 1,2-diacylglycerol beta-glucosyltransferase|nr:galactosyldiacylglycerol synthase [Paenibacillaceae bacterium]
MGFANNGHPAILILTGNLGDGHRQAASAIADTAARLYPGARIRVVDITEGKYPRLNRLSQYLYMLWITKFPWVYGYLFKKTKEKTVLSHCLKRLPLYSLDKLRKLLGQMEPSVVVSTFPAASAAISRMKEKGLTAVPAITVITDHTYHSYWLHPGTDRYIVGSEHVRQALRRWPVPDGKIAVTGIPIRRAFAAPQEKRMLRQRLGFDSDLPLVMIMGGGCGLIGGNWAGLLADPGLLDKPVQVIIVCGRNEELRERLIREMKDYPHRLIVQGYVDNVHELMAAADLLITKPGGLTSSEALASELPMLLYKPLPGQEYDNAAYLTAIGAAVQARNQEEFVRHLAGLLKNPQQLAQMKASTRLFGRRESAESAVRAIMETAHTPLEAVPIRHKVYAKA